MKRFKDPRLLQILDKVGVNAKTEMTDTFLKPFNDVIDQLYAYYENINTSVSKAENLIQELESLKFDSESYKSAKAELTAAVDKHKELKKELSKFQTEHMSKVNTGTFDL